MTEINTDPGGGDTNQPTESADTEMQAETHTCFFANTVGQHTHKTCKTQKSSYELYLERRRRYVEENTIVVSPIPVGTSAKEFIMQWKNQIRIKPEEIGLKG